MQTLFDIFKKHGVSRWRLEVTPDEMRVKIFTDKSSTWSFRRDVMKSRLPGWAIEFLEMNFEEPVYL